jgi:hypothetical protein
MSAGSENIMAILGLYKDDSLFRAILDYFLRSYDITDDMSFLAIIHLEFRMFKIIDAPMSLFHTSPQRYSVHVGLFFTSFFVFRFSMMPHGGHQGTNARPPVLQIVQYPFAVEPSVKPVGHSEQRYSSNNNQSINQSIHPSLSQATIDYST